MVKLAAGSLALLRKLGLNSVFPHGMVPEEYTRAHFLAAFAGPAALASKAPPSDVAVTAATRVAYFEGCGMRMMFPEAAAETLASLRGRDGVVAVAGNHDDYGGGEPLRSSLRARGVELLDNAHRVYTRGEASLVVVGVDDVYSRRVDVERAFSGVPEGSFVVALAHEPGLFPRIAERGAALVLSGHTHWGQLGVPWIAERLNLGRFFYRYASGLARHGRSLLHVSPGLGTTFVPARLGVAPEMTLLVLRRAAPDDSAQFST